MFLLSQKIAVLHVQDGTTFPFYVTIQTDIQAKRYELARPIQVEPKKLFVI